MTEHPIFDYFNYDSITNISKCLVSDCIHPNMCGKHAWNLRKHLVRRHPHLIPELEGKLLHSKCRKKMVKKKIEAKKITINLSREDFLMGCTEMITLNGRPFSVVDDSGLRRIFDPIVSSFERMSTPVTINPPQLKHHANEFLKIVKEKISAEMKGKLLALELDLTKHFQRCFLGVNARFSMENETVVRTLALRRILVSTSALNIALEIEKILKEYEVGIDDVYAITTDNGANVLAVSNVIRIMQERMLPEFMSRNQNIKTTNVEILNELIAIEAKRILQGQKLHFVHDIHCSSHVFQLIIGDTLDSVGIKTYVASGRELVRTLRAPNVVNMLVSRNLKMPLIDSDTRWSSVHKMVSILHPKSFDIANRITN